MPTPYFVEYGFIADNHGGAAQAGPDHAGLLPGRRGDGGGDGAEDQDRPHQLAQQSDGADLLGRVPREALAAAMARKGRENGRAIYLVSDEPYRRIVYGGVEVPSPLAVYANSIVATSYSKELSLPGERIGFAAVNPAAADLGDLMGALVLANRILGFVNAPSLMQKVVAGMGDACVDVSIYQAQARPPRRWAPRRPATTSRSEPAPSNGCCC